jgi:hypothetical protein
MAHMTLFTAAYNIDCIACFVRVGTLFSIARYPYFYGL